MDKVREVITIYINILDVFTAKLGLTEGFVVILSFFSGMLRQDSQINHGCHFRNHCLLLIPLDLCS